MAKELWRLTLHYFGHLMRRTDSLGKTLTLGRLRTEEYGATEDEMAGITDSMDWNVTSLTAGVRFFREVSTPQRASQLALVVKNPPPDAGDLRDLGSIPGSGRSPGGGHFSPLQYSGLKNPMDRGA
ncbi:unnamed protein product [Rangifer tarandus platyrhynchus]|uniref:Uncharacterized protein n=2 Tax=Rangifer tarandus platyrhynchus TaxID=3082113 RepID=A0ABN9A4M9_RANTA|nr:unnamed protein product [Rangifer tarandus platyrhynchus]